MDGLLGGGWAGEQALVDQGREQRMLARVLRRFGGVEGCGCGDFGGRCGGVAGGDGFEAGEERLLPGCEGCVEIEVAVDARGERLGAEGLEALVEVGAELAEVLVVGVAEGEDAVAEVREIRGGVARKLLEEALRGVGWVAFAVGAGDQDGVLLLR